VPNLNFPMTHGNSEWSLGSAQRLYLWAKSLMPYRGLSARNVDVGLEPVTDSCSRPLRTDDFPLVFLTHNDRRLLPSFLAHYREMGVTRFICTDDGSTDGTREYLAAQPDVDLYVSNVRYKQADRGKIWREKLLARYGFDRWYLNVDSDEYFVYDNMKSQDIADYARQLDACRIRRVPAPMLDLYPIGGLGTAVFSGRDGERPWDIATHFDRDGYSGRILSNALSLNGGMRARVFGARGELMKYPLMRWDRYCSLGRTVHRPRPALYNFPPVMAALLHFKVFSDFKDRTRYAVEQAQHHKGAELYRAVLERIDTTKDLDLGYSGSIRYLGAEDLVEKGFMRPLAAVG